MKKIPFVAVVAMLFSCSQEPFIKHTMAFKKLGTDCTDAVPAYKMESNINGERYTFNKCLEDGFDGKQYTVTRQGDTLLVHFARGVNEGKLTLFAITLDVDANPKYNYILLDNELMQVVAQ